MRPSVNSGRPAAGRATAPGSTEPAPAVAARVAKYCHEHGVLVLVCGTYGNVIRLLPPLVIEFGLLDDALSVLADGIEVAAQ